MVERPEPRECIGGDKILLRYGLGLSPENIQVSSSRAYRVRSLYLQDSLGFNHAIVLQTDHTSTSKPTRRIQTSPSTVHISTLTVQTSTLTVRTSTSTDQTSPSAVQTFTLAVQISCLTVRTSISTDQTSPSNRSDFYFSLDFYLQQFSLLIQFRLLLQQFRPLLQQFRLLLQTSPSTDQTSTSNRSNFYFDAYTKVSKPTQTGQTSTSDQPSTSTVAEMPMKTSDSIELVLEESDVGNWVYKREGAANIVPGGYNGSNLHFVANMIRIQKAPRSKTQSATTSALSVHKNLLLRDIEGIATSSTKEIVGQLFIAEANDVKRTISHFQMHQVLKLHQGEISCVSDYDPHDLFSRSIGKINMAIKELFTALQNNLCIFLNGSLISEGLAGTIDSTRSIAGGEFEDTLEGIVRADRGFCLNSFLQLVPETIMISGVCGEWVDSKISKRCLPLQSLSLEEYLKIVRDYMIAAAAKDCSLMFSFRPKMDQDQMSLHNIVYLESINQRFDYKSFFIDLDMKPLKKMVHYYELDQKNVSCYTQKEKMKYEPPNLMNRNEHEIINSHFNVAGNSKDEFVLSVGP
ncbi:hypothetical protein GIB67_024271 [Kingdonia uniflora]|uniref:Inositol-pentakisphosphate 2-kinase n=1 Tax=Kingdonia uniflora TaxID=39325 RepID=A0A7J7LZM8_9MAGN|nr:hypothetical protein GIB67_024271 [Kingdonia uniflora]